MSLPFRDRFPAQSPAIDTNDSRPGWPWWRRVAMLGIGLGLLALLVVARCLQPNPHGFGTHEQLGFPPCGFIMAFGRACPSCGMTTAWSHFVRGDLLASAHANAGGFLLALASLPTACWLLISGMQGNWRVLRPNPVFICTYTGLTILAALLQWWWR